MNKVNKEFYLLRHGQTDFNVKKVVAGPVVDCPLNETGKEQAKEVRPIIASLKIETICHSPMLRVLQTMRLATRDHDCDRVEIDSLKECDPDTWNKLIQIEEHHLPCEHTLPFFEQVIRGLEEALTHPGPSLLIAHGGVHYALCHHLKIVDHPWDIDNCALVHFTQIENSWEATLV